MKIWNQDEGVLVTRVIATHEALSGQPTGTILVSKMVSNLVNIATNYFWSIKLVSI